MPRSPDSAVREGDEFARPLQRALRDTMWEHCGVVRSEDGIEQGLDKVAELSSHLDRIDVRPTSEGWGDLAHALDFRASLRSAEATLLGARERRESRGAHNRSDHTDLDPRLEVNLHVRLDDGELRVEAEAVPPVPAHLEEWARAAGDVEVPGRLLE